jgi:hypothetical protein
MKKKFNDQNGQRSNVLLTDKEKGGGSIFHREKKIGSLSIDLFCKDLLLLN